MKKVFFLLVALMCLGSTLVRAQYVPHITSERKPAPLPKVREADILWKKTVWRIIDLRERMNQPLYYPTKEVNGKKNLMTILFTGIEKGQFLAYDPEDGKTEFDIPLDWDQVADKLWTYSTEPYQKPFTLDQVNLGDIKQMMIKEVWFFDKQASYMQVRILGLCPILIYPKDPLDEKSPILKRRVCWIYFPNTRNVLSQSEVFNSFNDARNLSFYDVFLNRKFDGYIYQESNMYNNRPILSYAKGDKASEEAIRIENEIFNWEQDVWEY
ncbi:gliding motility protein GldN [Halosquirtibacter laminarini]|uniref:Gliding motility protein GldN n=1 Tax=Halosquirtibacter laminarini TaxID=3374600 RepID=A0AC61NNA8_9BACT|nr:gliding motility protein GldN [Prolixibacteraceae bacterium]